MNAENSFDRAVPSQLVDDPLRAQISALLDGELDDAASERAIDALLASDELVGFWADCHRTGDWMRSDEVIGVGESSQFMQRFAARLASEPTVLAPKAPVRSRSNGFWIRNGLPGVAVAAALVAVVWVASPFGRDEPTDKLAIAAPSGPVLPVVAAAVVAAPVAKTVDADQLSDYFSAHRDVTPFGYRGASARPAAYSPPANRTGTLTQ